MKLNEALMLLEVGAPRIKDVLKDMLSGDFQNLKEAFFKGEEGTLEYARQLKKLLDFGRIEKTSEAFKILKVELRAAEAAKKAWQNTKLGKYL